MTDRYYVYIVKCESKDGKITHYTGYTKDPQKRFKQHQGLLPGGAKYCLQRKCLEMFVMFAYDLKSTAITCERDVKRESWYRKNRLCEYALFSIRGGE